MTVTGTTAAAGKRSMRTFFIIMGGQLLSLVGSGISSFAFGVWLYDQTGKAMPYALTALMGTLPQVLLSPVAGAFADRYDRKRVMIIADACAMLTTVGISALLLTGNLQAWHVYIAAALIGLCSTFQRPAMSASITMLVDKEQFTRANGIRQAVSAVTNLAAPLLAGVLYGIIGLRGIVLIDIVTAILAIMILFTVYIPMPEINEAVSEEKSSIWKEAAEGFRYIADRSGLMGMMIWFAFVNFFANLTMVLVAPLILSFADAGALGVSQTVSSLGMLIGSIVIGAWGGPKKKMVGVCGFIILASLGFLPMGYRQSVEWITFGFFWLLFWIPMANGMSSAIWQSKVEPTIQGRVFASRGMISMSMMPIAFLLSGFLADGVFEPLMAEGGRLASTLIGDLLGTGPGRGIGLMLILSGLIVTTISLIAVTYRPLRRIETDLPDFDEATAVVPAAEPMPAD